MFKLPSIKGFLSEAFIAFKRFPLAILVSIVGTLTGIYLINCDYYVREHEMDYLWKLIMCCYLGLNFFISIDLFSESKNTSRLKHYLLMASGLILLIIYYFTLPDFSRFTTQDIARYILFVIGLHLLVSISPFISNGHLNGFWQFNKSLFIRILTSALYTSVLFIGLALALLAIEKLFKVDIKDRYYFDLWWLLAGIFNTWFFLSGIPKETQHLDALSDYPKGLKIFTQFVLLPLIAIYLIILYAYGIKISAAVELPKGWVSYLVLSFSVVGILSILLIWPIRNIEGNNWIKKINTWFYIALCPLITLLGLAIYERVSEYGITENRYFIILLTLWLTAITIYFLVSKLKNIKLIPISLCLIAFLSSFGPWSAFSVSEHSQRKRLENLLIQEKILVDGKIKKAQPLLSNKNAAKINDLVGYFDDVHGFNSLQPWFTVNLDSIFNAADTNKYNVYRRGIICELLGVDTYSSYDYDGRRSYTIHKTYLPSNRATAVQGYDYFHQMNEYFYERYDNSDYSSWIFIDTDSIKVNFNGCSIHISNGANKTESINFITYLKNIAQKDSINYGDFLIGDTELKFTTQLDSFQLLFDLTSVSGIIDEHDSISVNNISTNLYIKKN